VCRKLAITSVTALHAQSNPFSAVSSISDQFGTVLPPHLGLHHKLEERITESPAELTYVLDGLNQANRPDATADSKFLKVLAQVF
jgi:hypothetical protein